MTDIRVQVIQHDDFADLPLERIAFPLHRCRACQSIAILGSSDRHTRRSHRGHFPEAPVAVLFKPAHRHRNRARASMSALDTHNGIDIMRSAAADNRRWSGGTPLEQFLAGGQCLGSQCRAKFPGLMPLVYLRLVSLGLIAREIGEDTWKSHWHQRARAIRPLELAK